MLIMLLVQGLDKYVFSLQFTLHNFLVKQAETKVLLIYSLTFKVSTPIRFGIGINSTCASNIAQLVFLRPCQLRWRDCSSCASSFIPFALLAGGTIASLLG